LSQSAGGTQRAAATCVTGSIFAVTIATYEVAEKEAVSWQKPARTSTPLIDYFVVAGTRNTECYTAPQSCWIDLK
jgi:hypothetical protein